MKWLLAIGLTFTSVTGIFPPPIYSVSASDRTTGTAETQDSVALQESGNLPLMPKVKPTFMEKQAEVMANILEQKQKVAEQQLNNKAKISSVVRKLEKLTGRTPYVFSGSTPSGWDCSGLVMWAYDRMGVSLEHRASKQQEAGTKVEEPKFGDIVVFTYKGSKSAYHTAIYISEDTMIHAGGGKGETTSEASISRFAGNSTKVSYVRILDTP